MRTFRMNGVDVRWSATVADQEAWRCFKTTKGAEVIDAWTSIPGDGGLKTPRKLSDAGDLAALVAYSKPIG